MLKRKGKHNIVFIPIWRHTNPFTLLSSLAVSTRTIHQLVKTHNQIICQTEIEDMRLDLIQLNPGLMDPVRPTKPGQIIWQTSLSMVLESSLVPLDVPVLATGAFFKVEGLLVSIFFFSATFNMMFVASWWFIVTFLANVTVCYGKSVQHYKICSGFHRYQRVLLADLGGKFMQNSFLWWSFHNFI